jgi:hypothetical protein
LACPKQAVKKVNKAKSALEPKTNIVIGRASTRDRWLQMVSKKERKQEMTMKRSKQRLRNEAEVPYIYLRSIVF